MSAEFSGTITNVTEEPVGSTLDEDVSAGADALKPADPDQFNPDGGTLQIGDEVHAYTLDGDTLNLDGTLAQSYDEGTPVLIYPLAVERWAFVREPGGEEPLQVRVPHALWDRVPLGVRSDADSEEVECELTIDGVAVISDVIAREPRVDGGFIQDYTVRPEVITDGEPPASSPTPEVSGGIGSLVVRWDAVSNHDPVTYEVHVSDSQGFTPGPSTLAAEVQGTLIFIRTLPAGGPLQGGTTYYVRLIARDHDGAAAPSDEASGEIVVLNTGDIPSDGEVPPQVDTPSVTPGPGFLFVEWEPVENADPVAYEVHVSDNPLFDPGPSTLYATTPATSIVINKEPDGSDLNLETLYVVSIIATDPDGAGLGSGKSIGVAPAAQITETLIEDDAISTPKLQANAVIAGKIATNAVTADKINANAVTADKIATNAVTANKINAGAVTAGKIATNAVTADKILANEALFELLQTVLLVSNKIAVPGTSGRRLEFDQNGIRLYDSNDNLLANLPTDSNDDPRFHGFLEALGVVLFESETPQPTDDRSVRWIDTDGDTVGRVGIGQSALGRRMEISTAARAAGGSIDFVLEDELGLGNDLQLKLGWDNAFPNPLAPHLYLTIGSGDPERVALASEIPTIASGTGSVNVGNSNGAVSSSILHGLGVIPRVIVVTPRDSGHAVADVRSRTSASFTVGIKHRDVGANFASGTTVQFDWIALP